MNRLIETLNQGGPTFVELAVSMFWQSSLLILFLMAVDAVLRRRVRAVVRYGIWMLLLVKLLLPPSLWLPTGVGQWLGVIHGLPAARLESPRNLTIQSEPLPALSASLPPQAEVTPTPRTRMGPVPSENQAPRFSVASQAVPVQLRASGWALALWLLGMGALSAFLTHRSRLVSGWISRSIEAPLALREMLESCQAQLGLTGSLSIKVTPDPVSPAVCGVWRPVVLIPERLLQRLSPAQWRSVLLHELAHIQRQDVWVNHLQALLQIVYFYHPLIWLAQARIRQAREQAVDETVLVALGCEADDYPATLLAVARHASARPLRALGLVGILESGRSLNLRIRHLLDRPRPTTTRLGISSLLLIVAAGLVVLPMARGNFDTASNETSSSSPASGIPSTGTVAAINEGSPTTASPDHAPVVRVTLVNAENGQPVVEARVVANALVAPGDIRSAEAMTDERGQCQLRLAITNCIKVGITAYADGYALKGINLTPTALATPLMLKLARAVEFTPYEGNVLAPDGRPATGVEGAIYGKSGPTIGLSETGMLPLASLNPLKRVEVGPDGSYAAIATIYDEGFIFLAEAGYLRTSFTNLAKRATLTLKPWARVEGTLRIGREPGARQGVDLRSGVFNPPRGFDFHYQTETDAQGRFLFERVPPGPCEAARRIPSPDPSLPDGLSHVTLIEARAGETSHVEIGGAGRTVRGKILDAGQAPPANWNHGLHALVRQLPQVTPVVTANLTLERRRILAQEQARTQAKYYLEFQPDGSFHTEDVPPGTYRLLLNLPTPHFPRMSPELLRKYGLLPSPTEITRRFGVVPSSVPPMGQARIGDMVPGQITNLIVIAEPPQGRPAEPLDLGTLTLQPEP